MLSFISQRLSKNLKINTSKAQKTSSVQAFGPNTYSELKRELISSVSLNVPGLHIWYPDPHWPAQLASALPDLITARCCGAGLWIFSPHQYRQHSVPHASNSPWGQHPICYPDTAVSWRTCHQVFLSTLRMGLMVEISVYAQRQIRSLTWWVTPGLIRWAGPARWGRTRRRHTRGGLNIAAALAVISPLCRSLETYCSKYKDVERWRGFAWSKQTAWLMVFMGLNWCQSKVYSEKDPQNV